jgi:hypothetical protein
MFSGPSRQLQFKIYKVDAIGKSILTAAQTGYHRHGILGYRKNAELGEAYVRPAG